MRSGGGSRGGGGGSRSSSSSRSFSSSRGFSSSRVHSDCGPCGCCCFVFFVVLAFSIAAFVFLSSLSSAQLVQLAAEETRLFSGSCLWHSAIEISTPVAGGVTIGRYSQRPPLMEGPGATLTLDRKESFVLLPDNYQSRARTVLVGSAIDATVTSTAPIHFYVFRGDAQFRRWLRRDAHDDSSVVAAHSDYGQQLTVSLVEPAEETELVFAFENDGGARARVELHLNMRLSKLDVERNALELVHNTNKERFALHGFGIFCYNNVFVVKNDRPASQGDDVVTIEVALVGDPWGVVQFLALVVLCIVATCIYCCRRMAGSSFRPGHVISTAADAVTAQPSPQPPLSVPKYTVASHQK